MIGSGAKLRVPYFYAHLKLSWTAGMGAWVYHAWEAQLAAHGIEVLPVELPGHNSRMREPPATSLVQLASDIADAVERVLQQRTGLSYAIFGHSMGGWIAYEVVQPDFWAAFEARYGTGNPHLANPKVRQLVWPVLRADFALTEAYELPESNAPVTVPTTVVAGERDARYTRDQIHAWSRHLALPALYLWLAGAGHDYVEKARSDLLAAVAAALMPMPEQAAAGDGSSVGV
ncbi:hypothetical protein GPECTOR_23g93 [Gonium pectorale]|uniref:Thioesterase domain-containing protein n=1 Tax=Gonium pectorale TaxID=33097 RepID=A0A150GH82_GONPE|nr:hypothetical protein GPECTOR_23g93 [Gonium pectorale]|eukprot:KXZ49167.1 hypothetical protein GPECTOR_23g93 [Gonium pectorale]